jgi:hypothetical protein
VTKVLNYQRHLNLVAIKNTIINNMGCTFFKLHGMCTISLKNNVLHKKKNK